MILATYYLSRYIPPDQFTGSPIYGEGKEYSNIVIFSSHRDGDYRVSITGIFGVLFMHGTKQMEIEIDDMTEEYLADCLQTLCNTFFITMELYQPLHISGIPHKVKPGAVKEM